MTTAPTVADLVAAIEHRYPRRWATEGDAVGLIVGAPQDTVEHVHYAVDPVQTVVDEAVEVGAQILVVHHPLLYRPVTQVAADQPKGRVIHDLIRHGIALYVAHTNADSPRYGVSESMALALGLTDLRPLVADPVDPLDKVVVFVPHADAQKLIDALAEAGAGELGEYERCAFTSTGEGTFRPGPAANPTIGSAGEIEVVAETRVEMVMSRDRREAVIAALRATHPYEEPAFDVLQLAGWDDATRGDGRVGRLANPMSLADFGDHVAACLPATVVGARVSGDLDATVHTVAVLGGAGDFRLDAARRAGVDVYVTSDLRHHPASEFREHAGPALVDVPHWAAEWTWLPVAQAVLSDDLADAGFTITSTVSRLRTDPWNHRAASPEAGTTDEPVTSESVPTRPEEHRR